MPEEKELIGKPMFVAAFLKQRCAVAERAVRAEAVRVTGDLENDQRDQGDERVNHPLTVVRLVILVTEPHERSHAGPADDVVNDPGDESPRMVKGARLLIQFPVACATCKLFVKIIVLLILSHGG